MNENIEVVNMGVSESTTLYTNIKLKIYNVIKDLFDILFSFVGIIMMLIVAIIVKISYVLSGDFNSIFFKQIRIGKNGKLFNLYKFRTMVPDADEVLFKLLKEDKELAEEYKINKKLKNDPRITKVGKIIRKLSFDELPQFINVYIGDMSIIGNRPYLPREKEDMGKFYDDIVKTRPGITGYWQVSGRSDTTFKRRLELEKYYSNNYSLWLDIKIFFKTFKVIIFGKGAE